MYVLNRTKMSTPHYRANPDRHRFYAFLHYGLLDTLFQPDVALRTNGLLQPVGVQTYPNEQCIYYWFIIFKKTVEMKCSSSHRQTFRTPNSVVLVHTWIKIHHTSTLHCVKALPFLHGHELQHDWILWSPLQTPAPIPRRGCLFRSTSLDSTLLEFPLPHLVTL